MKCVERLSADRVVRRVPDPEARVMVASGEWVYVPKLIWKDAGRPKRVVRRKRRL